jgi:hypothetical protein
MNQVRQRAPKCSAAKTAIGRSCIGMQTRCQAVMPPVANYHG